MKFYKAVLSFLPVTVTVAKNLYKLRFLKLNFKLINSCSSYLLSVNYHVISEYS